jgi:diguanylate cyclase (GGDEF)-like protein
MREASSATEVTGEPQGLHHPASLSLILCDVDFFKLYNDSCGHLAGDRCLQQVAEAIRRAVERPSDLVARYGGEEFVVLLPNTDAVGAVQIAQKIRQEIGSLRLVHPSSTVSGFVTLSLGVTTTVPSRDSSPKELLSVADKALYQAKESGRDRLILKIFLHPY